MSAGTEYDIGAPVSAADGEAGTLVWVVVDPVRRALTHIVVEPKHRQGLGHLVPVHQVATAGEGGVTLRCSLSELGRLPAAEETQFLPDAGGLLGYGAGQAMVLPYFGLGGGGLGTGMPQGVVHDHVPLGEVQVRRGDQVQATDGPIGSVEGLVIDAEDHVTHVLLKEGHLWGRKQVAIPISSVSERDDGGEICVALTKDAVKELPPVDLGS